MNKRQNQTDGELIEQYKEGRTSVLPTLVKRYHKIFCEKAYWLTKDKESAKDIAQESWVIIINKLHTLEKATSFRSWAFRIIYTKAIDVLNQRNKNSKKLNSIDIVQADQQPSDRAHHNIQKVLLNAIQKLPKEKQDIIRLFYTEEYSINEISSFLNIPIGTVKSRLFKAREKLKSIIQKMTYEK